MSVGVAVEGDRDGGRAEQAVALEETINRRGVVARVEVAERLAPSPGAPAEPGYTQRCSSPAAAKRAKFSC